MTAKQIYFKTMPFMWIKLALGLATVLISAILFGIFFGIAMLFGDGGVGGIMLIVWISATGVVRFALMHYVGYLAKAGHIAVIATAMAQGAVPDDQIEVGKRMVKERFATSNIYFAVDKLVAGAVKQLQNVLQKAGNALDFVPGMQAVVSVGKLFIDISLGYVDECCLGYTFYQKEQGAFKSAADGVVVYAQNWKVLLKNAAKTTGIVLALLAAALLVVFLLLGGLFRLLGWNGLVAFLLSIFIVWAIKYAFIDSWILVKMMHSYMEVAPTTQITFDLYQKLCGVSSKFKELWNKGREERPAYAMAGAGAAVQESPAAQAASGSYCGRCGAQTKAGAKFCPGCGAAL